MPKAELLLWVRLRRWRDQGIRVRRQHTIGPYIADFAIIKAKVAIECDGSSHDQIMEQDHIRQACLESEGWQVLRFHNLDIIKQPDAIVDIIYEAVSARLPDPK